MVEQFLTELDSLNSELDQIFSQMGDSSSVKRRQSKVGIEKKESKLGMSDIAQALLKRGHTTEGRPIPLRKTKVAFGTVVGSKFNSEGVHVKWSGALL